MISVIVPCYREIGFSVRQIRNAALRKDVEIIVVDATPLHEKRAIKRAEGFVLLHAKKGRATQMNAGAAIASGEVLLFLHADTVLPKHWDCSIMAALSKGAAYGGFLKRFSPDSKLLSALAFTNNCFAQCCGRFLGDNAIFVRRKVFEDIGGYPEIELMEDAALRKKLRSFSRCIVGEQVITSSRRFLRRGMFRTLLAMQYIRMLYVFGVPPLKLAAAYEAMTK